MFRIPPISSILGSVPSRAISLLRTHQLHRAILDQQDEALRAKETPANTPPANFQPKGAIINWKSGVRYWLAIRARRSVRSSSSPLADSHPGTIAAEMPSADNPIEPIRSEEDTPLAPEQTWQKLIGEIPPNESEMRPRKAAEDLGDPDRIGEVPSAESRKAKLGRANWLVIQSRKQAPQSTADLL